MAKCLRFRIMNKCRRGYRMTPYLLKLVGPKSLLEWLDEYVREWVAENETNIEVDVVCLSKLPFELATTY